MENLVSSGQLEECFGDKVRCALLQKHKHLNSRKEHHENKLLDHIRYIIHQTNHYYNNHVLPLCLVRYNAISFYYLTIVVVFMMCVRV